MNSGPRTPSTPDPRAALWRPGDVWVGLGKPLTGLGAVRVRLTPELLLWETGTLRSDSQQVALAHIVDVDGLQSMVQRARGVGSVRLTVARPHRLEVVVLLDLPEHRDGVAAINEYARRARHFEQQRRNTQHVNYQAAPGTAAPVPAAPVPTVPTSPGPPQALRPRPHDPQQLPPSAEESTDVFSQIERLGTLRDRGFLSEEEFQAKKAELLTRL